MPLNQTNPLYQEGSFTPGFSFSFGNTGVTYFEPPKGHYIKIGNMVWIYAYVSLNTKGTDTGAVRITGMPFASGTLISAHLDLSTDATLVSYPSARSGAGNTYMNCMDGVATIWDTAVADDTIFIIWGWYCIV
jgi:hypothetical protein